MEKQTMESPLANIMRDLILYFAKGNILMRAKTILFMTISLIIISSNSFAAFFRANITNDSTKSADKFFTVSLYCTNDDTIPFSINRSTWVSPITFSGNISIQWLDGSLMNNTPYFDDATILKYASSQFNNFWDLLRAIYVESWDNNLPDRFSYTGIANSSGYPPALGEIKVLSWRAKTASTNGMFCMEQGDMDNELYDWLFDDPTPNLPKNCWRINADTLELLTAPVFDPIADQTIKEDSSLILNIKVNDPGGLSGLIITAASLPPRGASFVDNGGGKATFSFLPDYDYCSKSNSFADVIDTVYFYATDGISADTEEVVIYIQNSDRSPVLAYIPTPKFINVGKKLSFTIFANDPDSDLVTFQLSYALGQIRPINETFTILGASDTLSTAKYEMTPDISEMDKTFNPIFQAIEIKNSQIRDVQLVKITVKTNTAIIEDLDQGALPTSFELSQNYPNPFNPSTTIEFATPTATHVKLNVFNILGQSVKTLVDETLPVGRHSVIWDGTNNQGRQVASGIYFYRMDTKDFRETKKLLLLK
jgi:hypothetical protein